jgi:D-amino peptidase
MKVFISADIEGTAGITNWEEADKTHPAYQEFRERMTDEVVAACEGAIEAGAKEIVIKDAHGSGRNIIAARLPDCAKLVRAWSGHPFCMVQELDESFDALMFVGYHSKAGSDDNPLAHTLRLHVMHLMINGEIASEFHMHAFAGALVGVPSVFLSGDSGICADAQRISPGIVTVPVSRGIGPSTLSIAPALARKEIRAAVARALKGDLKGRTIKLPDDFTLEIKYTEPVQAYRASWYPGAEAAGPRVVRFKSKDYFEILRAINFMATTL